MCGRCSFYLAGLALVGAASSGQAQPPAVVPIPEAVAPVALLVQPPPAAPPVPSLPENSFIALHLLVGQQSGIRGQYFFGHQDNTSWVAEVFYGATLTRINTSEGLGGGIRRTWRRPAADHSRAVSFSPGIDFLYQFEDGGFSMLAPTVEVSYQKCFDSTGCGWEIGIIGGIGVGVGGRDRHGEGAAGQVTPLISLFTGFRF